MPFIKINILLCLSVLFWTMPVFAQADVDLFSSPVAPKNEVKVDTKKDFTANLEDAPYKEERKKEETWLKSLISRGTGEILNKVKKDNIAIEIEEKQKSNVINFDISGIKLRMTPTEIHDILSKQGFTKIMEDRDIPNFIKWRTEEICRLNGVIGFERLNICSTNIAKANNLQFIKHEMYNRYPTRESIEVFYTSTYTNNLSHLIVYKSDIAISSSQASKNVYLNNLKVLDWWQRIDLKYGAPDNISQIKWGLGGKKPYLKADFRRLELGDPLLKSLDTSRMVSEDQRLANTEYFNF